MKKIVVVSGGFDPVHSGHISYLKEAKNIGDKLIVALNSDKWLENKKGKYFMNFHERRTIIENFSFVDSVIDFEDDQFGSACLALKKVKKMHPNDKLIFCNGGDRSKENFLEQSIEGFEFLFGIGGKDKINSSSWILKKYENNVIDSLWGNYSVIFNKDSIKVKSLTVKPHSNINLQRHKGRSKLWFVCSGKCIVNCNEKSKKDTNEYTLNKYDNFLVEIEKSYLLVNPFDEICEIIEIQYDKMMAENYKDK
ncbi:adenylyltransferase/cytidyltransferase family protein [Gammaproteobacteria bacterium]|nr:adenylyltransferase/cytidyltransferase family protein [Gammaproteobacteria bacterium]